MRIIAGTARSLKLKTLEGLGTRPTTDRIKETLFNMLQPYIPGAEFWDLFSGSGAIGLEALSRGASKAIMVENNQAAVKIISENLEHTKLSGGTVLRSDVLSYLASVKEVRADVIFMDPPYEQGLEKEALSVLSTKEFKEDTLIVVEAIINEDFSYVEELGFEIEKEKKYKSNKHVFLRKAQ